MTQAANYLKLVLIENLKGSWRRYRS